MSQRFRRNIPILKGKKMIERLSDDTINALCDCASDIKQGNVPLTTKHFKSLKPFHKQIKTLSRKSTSRKRKRQILQSGGFLGFLLKPLAQILLGGLTK